MVAAKPGLKGYFDKKVILGIRPSDFEDSAFADASWPLIDVSAGVTEQLGTDIHAIFAIDAPPIEHTSSPTSPPAPMARQSPRSS